MTWGWVNYQEIFILEVNVEKDSSDYLNVPHTKKKRFAESFFGKPKQALLLNYCETPFSTFVFKSVVCDLWQRPFEYLLDCILRQEDWEDKDPGASMDNGGGHLDIAAPLDIQDNQDVQWVYQKHRTCALQDSWPLEYAGLKNWDSR